MCPWSVMPSAGCPSAAAAPTTSAMRAAPSSMENSVWTWRWVNESATASAPLPNDNRVVLATVHRGSKVRRRLQVGAGTVGRGALAGTARQLGPHLLELLARRHLLGEERGLDAVEEPLEPSDELGLGHPQFGLRRRL